MSIQFKEIVGDVAFRIWHPLAKFSPVQLQQGEAFVENIANSDFWVIVLSPHCDDVELSMGGTIAKINQGRARLRQIVVFKDNQPLDRIRRAEVLAAGEVLGTKREDISFLGIPEAAVSRKPKWLYRLLGRRAISYLALNLDPSDYALETEISEKIKQTLSPELPNKQTIVFAPISGRGRHKGHKIVQGAARKLGVLESQIIYFDEYPYNRQWRADQEFLRQHGLSTICVAPDTETKLQAIDKFTSQLADLFPRGTPQELPAEIFYIPTQTLTSLLNNPSHY